jgi:uroporphyrinogen-III synthase
MLPLIVIRPEPGCSATVAAARALGLDAHAFPLFAVAARDWPPVPAESADLLLIGSANAIRCGGASLEALRHMPVHAVGETTAQAARQAGFTVAHTGSGGLQAVLDAVPAGARVLRLAGEERIALEVPPGVTMIERVVYASLPCPMPDDLASLLAGGAVVLLHSGEAARHFAAECDRLGLRRSAIALAALAPRIAAAAGSGWAALTTAEEARDAALLALAAGLCQSSDEMKG